MVECDIMGSFMDQIIKKRFINKLYINFESMVRQIYETKRFQLLHKKIEHILRKQRF